MSKTKQNVNLFQKYKKANITRFIAEVIFLFALSMTYASMVAEFFIALGPLFLITTFISLIVSIIFEVKRFIFYRKIKKSESKVEKV